MVAQPSPPAHACRGLAAILEILESHFLSEHLADAKPDLDADQDEQNRGRCQGETRSAPARVSDTFSRIRHRAQA
jgi:hypothetical protein